MHRNSAAMVLGARPSSRHPEPVRQLQLAASCAVCYRELSVNPTH